ncbi:uncharacterized protein LOC142182173 [Nicotiana tabacum]|uniref:Uncharacterized protein LOC142182173 n=1 Tax=Nicotiana tabacum TaxID=4097 RepID=A0AC58US18_TOBAC
MANTWYETVLLGRPTGAAPLTWDEFTKLFKNHFLPDSLMQQYARDFERLVQTLDMDVSTYNTKFCKLAIYAPHLVPTEEARVQRFVDGLVSHLYTAVAPQMKTLSYSDVVDLARKIENKGREERAASDLRKKAKTRGAFKDRVIGDHHLLDILGHHLRDFPQPPRNFNPVSIQSSAPTQTTRDTLGATGTGNIGRGAGDRATVNQGQGNAGRSQARVFAFTRQDAQASNAVVTGILSVCSFDALVLIDPVSTHSYVSSYFALRFNRQPELLNDPFLVATPIGESFLAEYAYRACQIRVEGRDTLADLIIVKFEIPNEPSFILRGSQVPEPCKIVSFMKAQRLLKKGCLGVLAIVNDTRKETVSIENVPVVREFSDAKSSLVKRIKATQYKDERLCKYRDEALAGKSKDMIVESDGVLRMSNRLSVADVDGLRHVILKEAHNAKYTIHPGSTKMYHDLKQFYWWEGQG